jgi:hypothetical protein
MKGKHQIPIVARKMNSDKLRIGTHKKLLKLCLFVLRQENVASAKRKSDEPTHEIVNKILKYSNH